MHLEALFCFQLSTSEAEEEPGPVLPGSTGVNINHPAGWWHRHTVPLSGHHTGLSCTRRENTLPHLWLCSFQGELTFVKHLTAHRSFMIYYFYILRSKFVRLISIPVSWLSNHNFANQQTCRTLESLGGVFGWCQHAEHGEGRGHTTSLCAIELYPWESFFALIST